MKLLYIISMNKRFKKIKSMTVRLAYCVYLNVNIILITINISTNVYINKRDIIVISSHEE